jgi:prefoldin beta subunit
MEKKETEDLVTKFQSYQQQLQSVLLQKESLKLQNIEIERALEELNSSKQKSAYKITGSIMISKPIEELKKELSETKENIDIRIKSLEKTEEKISSKLREIQEKLKELR